MSEIDKLWNDVGKGIDKLQAENYRLHHAIREAYEVYAGSEHCQPETAPEQYMDDIITQMKNVLSKALSDTEAENE